MLWFNMQNVLNSLLVFHQYNITIYVFQRNVDQIDDNCNDSVEHQLRQVSALLDASKIFLSTYSNETLVQCSRYSEPSFVNIINNVK